MPHLATADPDDPYELDLGDRRAPVTVRINRRARRFILRVDALKGGAVVTVPSKRAIPEGLAFAQSRADWVRRQLDDRPGPRPFTAGSAAPFRGEAHTVVNEGGARRAVRRATGDPPSLVVGGAPEHVNRRLVDWMKRQAREHFMARADAFAAQLGVRRGPVSIRDGKSRWGSCSATGAPSFSWRLIMAPDWVTDYVAAHECAHLIRMDHSPAFWAIVADLGCDAEAARDWFAENGAALHAYGVPAS
ncbi:MAG: SprT family zinc-dependent metalloprotease [Pseudomonadota bacterium]